MDENIEIGEMRKMKDYKRKRFDVIIGKNLRMKQNIVGKLVKQWRLFKVESRI